MKNPQIRSSNAGSAVNVASPKRWVAAWRAARARIPVGRGACRLLTLALLGAGVLTACTVLNGTLFILGESAGPLAGPALGFFGDFSTSHHARRAKALAAGSYTLASSTPYLPFMGNRSIVLDPLGGSSGVSTAILQRGANCSLTETVIQPVNGQYDTRQTIDLPNAQDYFHQIAGLATQADVFPKGCADSTRGKRSVGTAQPISVSNTIVRFADLNLSSEQLEVKTVDRVANTLTTTTLTPGRVRSFTVVDVNGDGQNDIVASGVGYGAGVSGNIVVYLNNGDGTFRTAATFASNGSTFVVDDVDGDGKPDIVIDNGFDSNGTAIPGVSTLLGNGDGTFRTALVSATTVLRVSGPMVTGDFNGDGKPDLLLADQVVLNNGNGTFSAGPALPASVQAEIGFDAAVGDVDRDGKLDAVYTGAGFVQVLLGNGDGSFRLGARYASVGSAQPVAVSEIDGDGNLDIVVGNASQGIVLPILDNFLQRIQILLGRGDGTFVAAPIYGGSYTSNSSAPQLATADFDSDGKLDALVISNASLAGLDVLPGIGQGAFGAAIHSTTVVRASMVVAADLNGDGKPDVVAAGINANALPIVATLFNQGGARFAAERDYALPNYPTAIAVGDFDGDGRTDVAVAVGNSQFGGSGPTGVYVLFGQADGTLSAPVRIDTSVAAVSIAAADINGDGRADLVVADFGTSSAAGALHIYLGRADRTFTTGVAPSASGATRYTAVAFGDVNGDGRQDLLVGGSVPGTSFGVITPNLYTFLGNGDGTFQAALTEPLLGQDGNGANAIAIADFNNDGKADVVVGNQADYTEVLLGQGNGTWAHGLLALGERPNTIVAADLDNDHYPELLIGAAGAGTAVFRNAGTVAAWTPPTATTTPTNPTPPTTPTTPISPTTGDFSLSVSPASGTIASGQSVQTLVAAMPTADFAQTVTLSCSAGLPAGASCAFTPSALSLAGGVAGSSSLTITTKTASALGSLDPARGWPEGLVVTAFGSIALMRRRRRGRWGRLLGLMALAMILTSCGGDNGGNGNASPVAATPPAATGTTYAVTITATAASTSHTTTYNLTLR